MLHFLSFFENYWHVLTFIGIAVFTLVKMYIKINTHENEISELKSSMPKMLEIMHKHNQNIQKNLLEIHKRIDENYKSIITAIKHD